MPEDREAKEILSSITDDMRTIVRGELDMAKAEVLPAVKKGGIGAGLFGGAGYFALNALSLLFIAGAIGIAMLINDLWALGFVIMGVLLLIVAGVLALIGKGQIEKAKAGKPTETIAQANTTVAEVKGAVKRANAQAKGPPELPSRLPDRELR